MHQVWKYKLDHVAFWLITILFYAFIKRHLAASHGWGVYLQDVLLRNLLLMGASYFNLYFLFEQFFRKGKYWIYFSGLAGLLVVYTTVQNVFDNANLLTHAYYNFSIGVFYIAFTLALELSKRWYRQQLLLHKMETEKLQTELKYLKAQINPHFLFNSINTIYFQIDQSNTDARESLLKFSELLRYQLYECNEDKIPIEKEMNYIESYVDLQRLRNNHLEIQFSKEEKVRDFKIAPLLLLPFVENAFKHLSTAAEAHNIIELQVGRQNDRFRFCVTNSTDIRGDSDNASGIGLKNVRRRLDLLYADKYALQIAREADKFSIKLELEIE